MVKGKREKLLYVTNGSSTISVGDVEIPTEVKRGRMSPFLVFRYWKRELYSHTSISQCFSNTRQTVCGYVCSIQKHWGYRKKQYSSSDKKNALLACESKLLPINDHSVDIWPEKQSHKRFSAALGNADLELPKV